MEPKGISRKVFHVPPGERWNIKSIVASVQREFFYTSTWLGNNNIKAAAKSNNNLFLLFVSMSASLFPARHIIRPENPLYFKWNMLWVLKKGKVASGI